jgi:hypothetical protein
MNRVPPSSRFFFNSGPKKVLSLSLNVKCDQQTHKKRCLQLWHQSKKSSNKVPMIIFRCYIMGGEPLIIEQFFYGFEDVIMGSIMEVKILWVRIMGVTLVSWCGLDQWTNLNVSGVQYVFLGQLPRKMFIWSHWTLLCYCVNLKFLVYFNFFLHAHACPRALDYE